jgi:hypothetical protein
MENDSKRARRKREEKKLISRGLCVRVYRMEPGNYFGRQVTRGRLEEDATSQQPVPRFGLNWGIPKIWYGGDFQS